MVIVHAVSDGYYLPALLMLLYASGLLSPPLRHLSRCPSSPFLPPFVPPSLPLTPSPGRLHYLPVRPCAHLLLLLCNPSFYLPFLQAINSLLSRLPLKGRVRLLFTPVLMEALVQLYFSIPITNLRFHRGNGPVTSKTHMETCITKYVAFNRAVLS